MKIITYTLLAALVTASSASAQTNSSANTTSGASSTLNQTFEGSTGVGNSSAGASNNTSDCIKSDAVGLGVQGLGLSFSNSQVEERCAARVESIYLINLVNMPNGPAKQAAIYHSCVNSPTLRHTLVALGYCVVRKSK